MKVIKIISLAALVLYILVRISVFGFDYFVVRPEMDKKCENKIENIDFVFLNENLEIDVHRNMDIEYFFVNMCGLFDRDGIEYVLINISEEERETFISGIEMWESLPLPEDLIKIISRDMPNMEYGDEIDTILHSSNGFFAYKDTSGGINDTVILYTDYIFSIFDMDTNQLFVFRKEI